MQAHSCASSAPVGRHVAWLLENGTLTLNTQHPHLRRAERRRLGIPWELRMQARSCVWYTSVLLCTLLAPSEQRALLLRSD